MIELYDYWRSSASYRVRIALGLAGLDWQALSVDLVAGAQQQPEHLARNPQGLVPVLDIDGQRFTQSLAIVEYLNETRDLGLLPNDPVERAKTRSVSHVIAMDIHPICNLKVARFATSQSELNMQDWMQAFITPGLAAVEQLVADDTPYTCGDTISLADICLMPQMYNAHRWQVDLTALPKLRAIETALAQHPAFAAAHPDQWAE
ncbi:maleylacetoacetate isomerase [Epibacterium sp. SM1969]|uniref:Maleylacetoacetate isomerase n=1 Tax=Tritonibacter aquimaris TaxID=2663379 RepID=A0A844ARV4_9RHOB|nr:maleylacetoacetate isomerase [Tritonibacter aquimaris]